MGGKTAAVGIVSKAGRYGGTYAHKDIAFEFASWLIVEFKLYLIKEFQRLKDEEQRQLGWDIKRNLVKINYRIYNGRHQGTPYSGGGHSRSRQYGIRLGSGYFG